MAPPAPARPDANTKCAAARADPAAQRSGAAARYESPRPRTTRTGIWAQDQCMRGPLMMRHGNQQCHTPCSKLYPRFSRSKQPHANLLSVAWRHGNLKGLDR